MVNFNFSAGGKEYGGMSRDQLRQMKELQKENERLRRAVSDLTLDKLILSEASRGKLLSPSCRRACIDHLRSVLSPKASERRICQAELLDGEIFHTLAEARIVVESWRRHYNTLRPRSSLGYRPPAPEVFLPTFASSPKPRSLAQRPTIHQHSDRTRRWGQATCVHP